MSRTLYGTSCVLLFAIACGGEDPSPNLSAVTTPALGPESAESVQNSAEVELPEAASEATTMPAGAFGRRLQVDHWVLSITSLEAFSASGNLLAQFALDVDSGVVESRLPDVGFKMLDDSENHLAAASRAYFDALTSDLQSFTAPDSRALESSEDDSGSSVFGTAQQALTVSCFTFLSDCQVVGFAGLLQGRWRLFTCENRTLFGCRAPFPIALVIP